MPLADEADLDIAFVVKTQNKWGMAVKKGNPQWLAEVNGALATLKATGALKVTWEKWMPGLAYPFG
ncbi:Bacterial extracellular solute-binding protein, family 3 [compost metagenome]